MKKVLIISVLLNVYLLFLIFFPSLGMPLRFKGGIVLNFAEKGVGVGLGSYADWLALTGGMC